MKKIIKYIFILLGIVLLGIQFIRPEKNNGDLKSITSFRADTKPTDEVFSILKKNCFDCHSNRTKYPWYAEIAPISFWLDGHIRHAKDEFNVSDWEKYSSKKKDHKLEELIEEIEKGNMPLNSYTWVHGNLSEKEKELLLQWVNFLRLQYQEELKKSSK